MPRKKKLIEINNSVEEYGFEDYSIPIKPTVTPLDLNLGREDLNLIVSKLNELIEYVNVY